MNNQELKRNIEEAIKSGSLERLNSVVQQAMIDKISALGLDDELRLEIRDSMKNITVPVRLRTETSAPEIEPITKRDYICNALIGLAFGLIMMALVTYTGWWSILICILIVDGYLIWVTKRNKKSEKSKSGIMTVIDTDSTYVMNQIDLFIDIIRIVSLRRDSEYEEGSESSASTLYKDYPNIVKWLQNLYAAQYEFDEAGRKYLFKHIPRLLGQVYYEVVMFDGNNLALFDIDKDPGIEGTELIYPAIVDTRTGKIVLKGRVCNP